MKAKDAVTELMDTRMGRFFNAGKQAGIKEAVKWFEEQSCNKYQRQLC